MVILDVIMIIMLLLTILYSIKLGNSIKNMESSHIDVISLIKKLKLVMDITERELGNIKSASEDIKASLENKIDDAERLGDDLSFMLKRSEKVVDTLDNIIKIDNAMKRKVAELENTNNAKFKKYLPNNESKSADTRKLLEVDSASNPNKNFNTVRINDIISMINEGRKV